MTDLERLAAHNLGRLDLLSESAEMDSVVDAINSVGTLVSREDMERLRAYECELESVANILQNVHPMGAAKHIGLRESATALAEVVEKQVVSHEDAALLREVKRMMAALVSSGGPIRSVSVSGDGECWTVSAKLWGGDNKTQFGTTLNEALSGMFDAAGVPDEKGE